MQMNPDDAAAALAAYHRAEARGCHPVGSTFGPGRPSALAEGARELGIDRGTMRRRLRAGGIYDKREDAILGKIGGPSIPPGAKPPKGFVIRRNSGEYDADGNLTRQWIESGQGNVEGYELPPGHVLKGESALLDANDNVITRWVKSREDDAQHLAEALETRFQTYDGAAPLLPLPASVDEDLCTIYPLPDLHFGMYSWASETGTDYDTEIARRVAREAIGSVVMASAPSKRAILLNLGDYFHQNDQKNATPASNNRLDVDGRWGRVYEAGVDLAIDLIETIAQRHDQVDVVWLRGNHDPDAAITLRVALRTFYRKNERIHIYDGNEMHWYGRHGACLFGATHGHTMKPERMAMMLAEDRAKDWGETKFRNFFFGHIHTQTVKEIGRVRVESFSSPAAPDGWTAGSGYRAARGLCAITFHARRGEIARHRANIIPPDLEETAWGGLHARENEDAGCRRPDAFAAPADEGRMVGTEASA